MHFPTLRLVIVSHRGLIGVETESESFWTLKAAEVTEKRRRVLFEHRETEADSCARKAD